MELSPRAKAARSRYQRERYQRRLKTAAGREQSAAEKDRDWLKKADEYDLLDEANEARKAK